MFAAGVGWIDERAATTGLTGSWSESVAYKGVWRHEMRKATADLLCQCAKRVTALYMITPSEEAAKAIKAAVGVVEQYKRIAAQPAKHKARSPRPRRKTGGTRPRRVPSRQTNFN